MEKFEKLTAVAAPMPASNIDTDIIMPKAFLKRIDKEGVLEGLFHDVRLYEDGTEREDFVLNQPEYRNAKILVTGPNFGCGSSREHAVWGLEKRGIKCLIGSSFAGIFFDNCANNGVLAIVLPKETVTSLIQELQNSPRAPAVRCGYGHACTSSPVSRSGDGIREPNRSPSSASDKATKRSPRHVPDDV